MPTHKKRTESEFPKTGATLTGRSRGRTYTAKVVSVDFKTGFVKVELEGKLYKSLSAAARSITGNEESGWVFWGLDAPRKHDKQQV